MKILKTNAVVDSYGLLILPVLPAGLTPGEQVDVVLASREMEQFRFFYSRRQGLKLPYHYALCQMRIHQLRRWNQRMRKV